MQDHFQNYSHSEETQKGIVQAHEKTVLDAPFETLHNTLTGLVGVTYKLWETWDSS